MRATLINRKRLVKCIIARHFMSEAEINNKEKVFTLLCTEEELRNKKDLMEIYNRITLDRDYIITKEEVKKLLIELEFKNMSDDKFEKLLSYCRHSAYELVYTKLGKCPWDYSSEDRSKRSGDLEEYINKYRPKILAIIEETQKVMPEIIGSDYESITNNNKNSKNTTLNSSKGLVELNVKVSDMDNNFMSRNDVLVVEFKEGFTFKDIFILIRNCKKIDELRRKSSDLMEKYRVTSDEEKRNKIIEKSKNYKSEAFDLSKTTSDKCKVKVNGTRDITDCLDEIIKCVYFKSEGKDRCLNATSRYDSSTFAEDFTTDFMYIKFRIEGEKLGKKPYTIMVEIDYANKTISNCIDNTGKFKAYSFINKGVVTLHEIKAKEYSGGFADNSYVTIDIPNGKTLKRVVKEGGFNSST